jgi:hypothetical protein
MKKKLDPKSASKLQPKGKLVPAQLGAGKAAAKTKKK